MELVGASTGQSTGQVWIENHPSEGWVPGRVDSLAPNGSYIVVDDSGEQFEIAQEKARAVDPACLRGVDDLLDLGDFNEGALLHNIRVRYFKDDIYTGIGGPILISMNPYAVLPSLYSDAKQKFYRDRSTSLNTGDAKLPPHLFLVGAASYMSMLSDNKNQSIIISGESGAGKTEATKRILTYFANLQADQTGKSGADKSQDMSIEQQVLRSNPILEAFGNAKTIRNDNSSRFGKFMEIEFDTSGKIKSARISNYLLEKCRIVTQQPDERGYHAFYQLLAGAPSMQSGAAFGLADAEQHAYTCGLTEVPGVNDAEDFEEMVECMHSLGFTTDERNSIFKIVAAVLHLGDVEFEAEADANSGTKFSDARASQKISELVEVEHAKFTKVFGFKTLEDPFTKKIIDRPQDPVGASNTRHSMAKVLYSRLFDWLVCRINQSMSAKTNAKETRKIGILDIYGFEVFDSNSFEQLCINFANEKLQQHFNSHMFTLEQQLYNEEGIAWSHIHWQDNREIIDSLEKKPLGLFCLLDTECLMPNASDTTCLNKIYASFKTSKIVYKPTLFASTNFAVAHYAGEVVYDILSFLEKNTDKLHADIMRLFKDSQNALVKSLFSDPRFAPELAVGVAAGGARPAPKRGATFTARGGATAGGDRARQNVTVSMNFRQELDKLVEDLNKTNPRYIRCIKPNGNKQAHDFDSLDVQRQLRCAGMLESIRIRRAGYSIRRPFKEFFNRFRVLTPQLSTAGRVDPDYKELSKRLLTAMEAKMLAEKESLEEKSWQIGRSKVFLKEEFQTRLEKRIGTAVASYVIKIQKRWRGYRQLKRYRAMRKAGIALQAALRTAKAVLEYRKARDRLRASVVIQTAMRTAALERAFVLKRKGAITVQRVFRGWRSRRRVGKLKGKAAEDRIKRMREDEARKAELEAATKAAAEKERKLEEMQRQLASERERAQKEAQQEFQRQLDETKKSHAAEEAVRKSRVQAEQETQQMEKMRQDMLDLRKENAKLQGQLDSSGPARQKSSADDAELEHVRRELQELRREKARMEVELATAKSPAEYEALSTEVSTLRDECSTLRRGKLNAELQLEQSAAQLESARAQAARSEKDTLALDVLRTSHDELQVEMQRLQAQKAALEERAKGEEALRAEVRELRLEKMRVAGELETSKMREEAMSDKIRNSERGTGELQQQRQRVVALESDLEASISNVNRLREQVNQLTKENFNSRTDSLDQLRNELLSRIEAKPAPSTISARPSIMPGASGEGAMEERHSLLNQRALFEKMKQQFQDTAASGAGTDLDAREDEAPLASRELELAEEVRQAQKENVELKIRVESLQDELVARDSEVTQHLNNSALLRAELQDLKFQLDSEGSESRRLAVEVADLKDRLAENEGELNRSRTRLGAVEERAVRAEDDLRAASQRLAQLQQECDAQEVRQQQLQRQYVEATARERTLQTQLEDERQIADNLRKISETAERSRAEGENSARFLEAENERLRAEVDSAHAERSKIKDVVDELVRAEGQSKSEELQREAEKWKKRAGHFEREYNKAKELNTDMTNHMAQMLQAVSERTDESGDLVQQNKVMKKQLETRAQEIRMARLEKEEVQKQLDSLQSTGTYFQDKYREASNELRTLKQEHSIATASASKLKARVESLQAETDDLKAQVTRLSMEVRNGATDSARIEKYEEHVRDLQQKLRSKDAEVADNRERFQKSQVVNDCLNTLLVLESEQASIYETFAQVPDERMRTELESKKLKAQGVIGRLNEMLNEDERPSIVHFQHGLPG